MTHQVIVDRDPGDETTHDPEGLAEQSFGANEGIYSNLEGQLAPLDEVLS